MMAISHTGNEHGAVRRRHTARRKAGRQRYRPQLETLEDRLTPSGNTFYADQVVGYVPGTIPNSTYNQPAAALGALNPVSETFDGTNYYLTPFDPAFGPSNLVEVGAGGSLILHLAQTAATNGYTIGIHTGIGLYDADYPSGTNFPQANYFTSWLRQADVQVSDDGTNWGDLGTITFSNPSNYYAGPATDPEGLSPGVGPAANPGQPFLGSLSSFNGQDWQGTLAVLNGSAGGTWLNLTGITDGHGTPITGVNYIKFVVPSNPPLDPNTGNPEIMMVDAVVGTNLPITADAGGPYLIAEGQPLTLDGSASTDPNGGSLTYSWTINGHANAASGVNPTLSWAQLQALGVDDGANTFNISVTVNDGNGQDVSSAPTFVFLDDTAPTATLSNNGPVFAGGGTPITASFTNPSDPSTADTNAGFHYSFALNSSGLATSYDAAGTATSQQFTLSTEGTYTIHGRIFDKDGGSTDYTTTTTVVHSPLTASPGGPYTISEGDPLNLAATGSTDGDGDPLSYAWTINGHANAAVGFNPTLTWNQLKALGIDDGPNTFNISVTVSDGQGHNVPSSTTQLTVNNTAPTLTLSGPSLINEGSTYTLHLSSSDPGADTISKWTITWGDGTPAQVVNGNPSSATHTYADGPNNYTINATATDEDGTWPGGNTISVNVRNVAPTIAISGANTVQVGSSYTLNLGAVTDPGQDTVTHYVVHWGDGTSNTYTTAGTKTHTYTGGPTTRSIQVDLTDEDGTFTNAGNALTVSTEVPPSPPPAEISPRVQSVSVAFDGHGQQVTAVVYPGDLLYVFDATGSHFIGSGVQSASVAYTPQGQQVLYVVFTSHQLWSYDAAGAHFIGSGVESASVTFDAAGHQITAVVYEGGLMYMFDATGSHLVTSNVQSVSIAFDSLGREVTDLVYTDGSLYQFDSTGSTFLGGDVQAVGLAYNRLGQRLLDVVFESGDLWQF